MKKGKITSKLFSISCSTGTESLAKILQQVAKDNYNLRSVSQSLTDDNDIVLITLDLEIAGLYVDSFIDRLKTIDNVLNVTVSFGAYLQIATYQIKFNQQTLDVLDIIRPHNAQIIKIEEDKLLIIHIASEKDILSLYNKLDTISLMGFSQIPIVSAQALYMNDQTALF